jgi:hypothetical protein
VNFSQAGINAAICRNSKETKYVHHNLNEAKKSQLFSSSNPQIALSDTSVSVSGNTLLCNFARENSQTLPGYLNIDSSSSYFLLVAFGKGLLQKK